MSSAAAIHVSVTVSAPGLPATLAGISSSITGATSSLMGMGDQIRRGGLELSRAGVSMTLAITAPLAAISALSIKASTDFELGMRRVASLIDGLTEGEFKTMYNDTKKLSVALGTDMVKATKALYEIISTNIPKENAIDFLATSTKAAIAGLTSTQTAVNALTTVINAYQMKTSDATVVSDALFMAVNKGKFTFEQLSGALAHALPIASQLAVGYKEILAAAAAMSLQGFTVNQSMIRIAMAMNSLLKPTKQMKELFKELGVETGQQLLTKFGGLQGALTALRGAAEENTSVLSKAIGRYQGLQAILGLTGKNAATFTRIWGEMNNSIGATDAAFAQIDKSMARTFERMKVKFFDLKVTIGETLAPIVYDMSKKLEGVIDKMRGTAESFKDLPRPIQDTTIGFLGLAAAAGPVSFIFGKIGILTGDLYNIFKTGWVAKAVTAMGGWSTVVGVLGKAFVALTVAVAALKAISLFEEWSNLSEAGSALGSVLSDIGRIVSGTLGAAFSALKLVLVPVAAAMKEMWEVGNALVGASGISSLGSAYKGLADAIGDVNSVLKGLAVTLASVLNDAIKSSVKDTKTLRASLGEIWDVTISETKTRLKDYAAAVADNFEQQGQTFKLFFQVLGAELKNNFGPLADWVVSKWKETETEIRPIVDGLATIFNTLWEKMKSFAGQLGPVFIKFAEDFREGLRIIKEAGSASEEGFKKQAATITQLQSSLGVATNYFNTLASVAKKGSVEYEEALLKMQKAQAALFVGLGQKIPKELQESIATLTASLGMVVNAEDDAAAAAEVAALSTGKHTDAVGRLAAAQKNRSDAALGQGEAELSLQNQNNTAVETANSGFKDLAGTIKQVALYTGDGVAQNTHWAKSFQMVQDAANECALVGIEVLKGSTAALTTAVSELSGVWSEVLGKWETSEEVIKRVNSQMGRAPAIVNTMGGAFEKLGSILDRSMGSFDGLSMSLETWMGMVAGYVGGAGSIPGPGMMTGGLEEFAKTMIGMGYVRTGSRSFEKPTTPLPKSGSFGGSSFPVGSIVGDSLTDLSGAARDATLGLKDLGVSAKGIEDPFKGLKEASISTSGALSDLGKLAGDLRSDLKSSSPFDEGSETHYFNTEAEAREYYASRGMPAPIFASMGTAASGAGVELENLGRGVKRLTSQLNFATYAEGEAWARQTGQLEEFYKVFGQASGATQDLSTVVQGASKSVSDFSKALNFATYAEGEAWARQTGQLEEFYKVFGQPPAAASSGGNTAGYYSFPAVTGNTPYANWDPYASNPQSNPLQKDTRFDFPFATGGPIAPSLNLNVVVNNADARKVADQMVAVWRSQGVDI